MNRCQHRPLRSLASPTLLAYVATAKYQDALPLYRQSQIFARHGADIPRNTLARWMVQAGERLSPLTKALRRHLLQGPLIHMDETTLQVNTETDRPASATSYMWLQRGGPPGQQVVLFDYGASRAGLMPVRLLGDYAGRQVLREQKSRPPITQLRTWLDKSLTQVLPKSALGRALHYLDGQWTRLTRFLDDGLIPLDNTPAENAIRPFVVGRKTGYSATHRAVLWPAQPSTA